MVMSVPTTVHIYSGLPHGFRRWTQLHATEAFGKDTTAGLVTLLGNSVEHEDQKKPWIVYQDQVSRGKQR